MAAGWLINIFNEFPGRYKLFFLTFFKGLNLFFTTVKPEIGKMCVIKALKQQIWLHGNVMKMVKDAQQHLRGIMTYSHVM